MSDLAFAQPERRSFLIPALIAVAVLGLGVALTEHFLPSTHPEITLLHTSTYAAHTVFKSNSIVVGQDPFEDDFYVVTTVHIVNHLRSSLDLKDFTATLTPGSAPPLATSAIQKNDLPNLLTAFPALKPLLHSPLLRDSTIPPGGSLDGDLVLRFPLNQAAFDQRKSLTLAIETYRQGTLQIPIPNP